MIPLYIPSRSRTGSILKARCTIPKIRECAKEPPHLFLTVPGEQVDAYRLATRHLENVEVLGVPSEYGGIARTRYWCAQHAAGAGHDAFMMLDDDVQFYRRHDGTRLRNAAMGEWDVLMKLVERELSRGFTAVGVSPREGNNRVEQPRAENTRLLRVFAFDIAAFLDCEHGRVPVMEDFDVMLQMLRRGQPNVNIYEFAQGQSGTQQPGGCSDYRTHELHEAAAKRLAELHPGLVRLRTKENKTGGEFGTRTEVTISWKKAYGAG